jgi:hypothetical protein
MTHLPSLASSSLVLLPHIFSHISIRSPVWFTRKHDRSIRMRITNSDATTMLTIAPELNAGPSVADTGVSPPVQSWCLVKPMVHQETYQLQNNYILHSLQALFTVLCFSASWSICMRHNKLRFLAYKLWFFSLPDTLCSMLIIQKSITMKKWINGTRHCLTLEICRKCCFLSTFCQFFLKLSSELS